MVLWELVSFCLEIVLVSVQGRCTVCAKRARFVVHVEIVLILMQDRCAVCVERTIGLEIVLDAPDGTPR